MTKSSSHIFASSTLVGWCCFIVSLLILPSSSVMTPAARTEICPPPETYAPCYCGPNFKKPNTIQLSCFEFQSLNLTDSEVSDILDVFVTTPDISPMIIFDAHTNQLTRIPSQIKLLNDLISINFYKNSITSVESGTFKFNDKGWFLDLGANKLTTIPPGTFKEAGYGVLDLSGNRLMTRFESAVFQSMLEKMAPYSSKDQYNYSDIEILANPIDCSDCHLAWLIRYNRNLMQAVKSGYCSNGTRFESLDPNGFADCPPFMCPLGYDGIYADFSNCSSYYICRENVAYHYDCPSDLVFNPETESCDVVDNVVGRCGVFACPIDNGLFPDPLSCNGYYVCTNYEPTYLKCPLTLVFNPHTDQCERPDNVPYCIN